MVRIGDVLPGIGGIESRDSNHGTASAITIAQLQYGATPLATETVTFDQGLKTLRGQPTQISVSLTSGGTPLTLGYGYCAGNPAPAQCAGNNGNVQSASILAPGPAVNGSQTFGYDTLNRLTSAVETPNSGSATTAWSQLYNYDAFGNRWLDPGSSGLPVSPFTPQYASNFGSGNNRLGIQNSTYDLAGNQTVIGGFTYSYDAENRVSVVTEPSPTTPPSYRYVYDGEGRRVQKIASGGPTTNYAYDAAGNLAAEYTSGTTASLSCATCYLVQDTLGSTRLVLDATTGSVAALHDYLPFGEELVSGARPGSLYAGNDNPRQKFTGKERDAETSNSAMGDGLDFFGARYFSGAQGRWTGPDWSAIPQAVPYADLTNPQSLNLYSYALNNPLLAADPDGHAQIDIRYTRIGPGYTHSYIVVTDTNGARTYFRAGPSAGGPSSGGSGALSSASGGSSSQSSSPGSSGSNSSNSSSPGSGPGGAGTNAGPFGQLYVNSGSYVQGTVDYETSPAASTNLLSNDQPAAGYINQLQQYENSVNQAGIPYNPVSTNSNAYAAGAAKSLGLTVPKPSVLAPGRDTNLQVTPAPPAPPPPPPPPCSVAGTGGACKN